MAEHTFAELTDAIADYSDAKDADIMAALDLKADTTTVSSLTDRVEAVEEVVETGSEEVTVDYAEVVTVNDALGVNAVDVKAKIEPVQDLHGYDKPWVGGAGKNLLPFDLEWIKANNTSGTWNGNTYTLNGITFVVNNDGTVNANGTASGDVFLILTRQFSVKAGVSYTLNGGLSNDSGSKQRIWVASASAFPVVHRLTSYNVGEYEKTTQDALADEVCEVHIWVKSGNTVSNQVFKPMIRLATETDATFAPYSNICPISGWDEVNVTRSGKNLLRNTNVIDGKYINSGGGLSSSNNFETFDFMPILPGNYRFSFVQGDAQDTIRIACYDAGQNFIAMLINDTVTIGAKYNASVIIPTGAKYIRASFLKTSYDRQLELGTTATDYEPYKGNTYTIDLNGTRYGGTLDVTSGELTLTHKILDAGNLNYTKYDVAQGTLFRSGDIINIQKGPASNVVPDIKCSNYATVAQDNRENGTLSCGNSMNVIDIIDNAYSDAATFKTAMSGVQVVYTLATPETIQLTPQEIKLLQGNNNLFSDTGDTQLTYYNSTIGNIGETLGELQNEDAGLKENEIKNGRVQYLENKATSQVYNSVTWTKNADGTVSAVSDGASANSFVRVANMSNHDLYLNKGRYKFTACPANGSGSTYHAYITDGNQNWYDWGDGVEFDVPNDNTEYGVILYVISGAKVNLVFKPMITLASLNLSYDDYVPYAKSNKELTEDLADISLPKDIGLTPYGDRVNVDVANGSAVGKIVNISFKVSVATALSSSQNTIFSYSDTFKPSSDRYGFAIVKSGTTSIPCSLRVNSTSYYVDIIHDGLNVGDTIYGNIVFVSA